VVGEARALPFPDDTFDFVTCQTVLIHVSDVDAVLAEFSRVTKPGGVVLAAEPDNLAGNVALLGGSPAPSDADVLELVALQQVCDAGKRALGEGDNRVGARLPGLFRAAGLRRVQAFTNDRCIPLVPPYDTPAAKVQLAQERAWIDEGVSILMGSRDDNRRFHRAAGADDADFDRRWAAMQRWLDLVREGIDAGTYHAARGTVFYLVAGVLPGGRT
jgi:SAM-dependent methyltransferase